jgi:hypothetical protein
MDQRLSFLMRPVRLAALLAIVCAAMLAQKPALAQGNSAERDACEGDALRLCSEFIPNVGAIEACLSRNMKNLTPACRVAMGGTIRKKKRSTAAAGQ